MNSSTPISTAIFVCLSFASPLAAQNLNALNLPQSGQTTRTLASRDDMSERLVALLWCEGSMIMGNRTLHGSDECLNLRGENFSATMDGRQTNFAVFDLETADLGLCETYISGQFQGGDWFSESLAFRYAGLTARYDGANSVIELTGAEVIWPEYRGDLTTITGNARRFVKGPDTVLLPYAGSDADHAVAALNEIGHLCAALGW